ncbi:MAG TPA: ROK family protein [Acidimicrobiales bacterium]|nr:ROK family protein [Acidimicrobiales bacterium]
MSGSATARNGSVPWSALVFDFGGTKVEVALAGPGHRVIGRATLPTNADDGAEQAVDRAITAGRDLLLEHREPVPAIVGVSSMGYTREDGVHLAPNVPGWETLRLPALLRQAFPGVPVVVENDVRAAAAAELKWGALAGVETGLYVNFGSGVAATLIIDGKVFAGSHGVAGEVGYWLVRPSAPPGSSGEPAGKHPTLEVEVGGTGVRERARSIGIDGGLAEVMSSAHPVARTLAAGVFAQIALSVTNMAILLDPERIVLGGGYTRAGDQLVDAISASLRDHSPSQPEVVIGHFGSDAGLFGAIALAEAASQP